VDIEQANDKSVTPNNDAFKDRKVSLYKPIVAKRIG